MIPDATLHAHPLGKLSLEISESDTTRRMPFLLIFIENIGDVYHSNLTSGENVVRLRREPMAELFSKGRAWIDFRDLESELVSALDYVPLRTVHDKVWSPKFGRFLDETGSAVDSFFKIAIEGGPKFSEYHNTDTNNLGIRDYENCKPGLSAR